MPIPSGSAAVDRTLLRDDVYRRLRDAIVDGTFTPGEQLKDGELADWLGVSRTPVREALLRLGTSGLVVALPGRSTTVSAIDARRCGMLATSSLQCTNWPYARSRAGSAKRTWTVCGTRIAALPRQLHTGDVGAALDADEELHRIPVAALGNHALEAVLDQFDPLVRRSERLRFSMDGHASVELHEQLIELIAAGDVQRAASVAFDIWHSLPAEDGSDG